MAPQTRRDLTYDLLEAYLDWREECDSVAMAYELWTNVSTAERGLAFAAYQAALDREEQASSVFAERATNGGGFLGEIWRAGPRVAPMAWGAVR